IREQQLAEANRTSMDTGLPLGRMLILMGAISHSVLAKALDLQTSVRDNKMSYHQAVKVLKTYKASRATLSQTLGHLTAEQTTSRRKKIRLGEFLMLAGVLTESDILNALELGLGKQQSVGDSLIELGLVSQPVLAAALDLQERVCNGNISVQEASNKIHKLVS